MNTFYRDTTQSPGDNSPKKDNDKWDFDAWEPTVTD